MQDAYVQALRTWAPRRRARPAGRVADDGRPAQRAQRAAPPADARDQAAAAAGAARTPRCPSRRRRHDPRRPPAADLHLLPPGAGAGGAGRAHAAAGVRRGDAGHRRTRSSSSETTMAARLTRAKKKIAAARIPYVVPAAEELPARVDAVLTVIHLLYATGHTAPSGEDLVRDELTDRALDLARMLRSCCPTDREAARAAGAAARPPRPPRDPHRRRRAGCCASRTRTARAWDRELIAEADRLVVAALTRGPAGPLHAAGGDRRAARPGAELRRDRLAADPHALRRAAARLAVAGRRAQPRGGGGDGRRAGGGAGRGRGARARRPAGRLPLPARHQGRPPAPPRPRRRGRRRLPGGAGAQPTTPPSRSS